MDMNLILNAILYGVQTAKHEGIIV
jgi:hypothetical protein